MCLFSERAGRLGPAASHLSFNGFRGDPFPTCSSPSIIYENFVFLLLIFDGQVLFAISKNAPTFTLTFTPHGTL